MTQIDSIRQLILPLVQQNNLMIYDVRFTKLGHQRVLEISLMDDQGRLTLDQAEMMTQSISELLDQQDIIEGEYILDIGSPGAERELKSEQEIMDSIDQYVFVKFKNPMHEGDCVYGYLRAVNEDVLEIEYQVKQKKMKLECPKVNVAMIRLAVKF